MLATSLWSLSFMLVYWITINLFHSRSRPVFLAKTIANTEAMIWLAGELLWIAYGVCIGTWRRAQDLDLWAAKQFARAVRESTAIRSRRHDRVYAALQS